MKQVKENVPKYKGYKIPAKVKERLQTYDDGDITELQQVGIFAGLPRPAMLLAIEMASDLMQGTIRSDVQLSADLGLHRNTIWKHKSDPVFNVALGKLAMGVIRGKVMKYVSMIEVHAAKDWRAAKFLMEWVGLFIPKSQHLNVNVSATPSQVVFETSEEAIFAFIKKVKSMGWSLERIAEIYNAD